MIVDLAYLAQRLAIRALLGLAGALLRLARKPDDDRPKGGDMIALARFGAGAVASSPGINAKPRSARSAGRVGSSNR